MKTRRALLIAMSGVRVVDPALRELGLTLPGFIDRGRVIASLPSLGLLAVAAHSPSHWELEYREIDELAATDADAIARAGYDLVAISSLSARILDAYRLADRLRSAGVTTVLGGIHATALPEESLRHADAVVQGDGERAWARLLRDFEQGALRTLYSSREDASLRHSLEEARTPRYDLLNPAKYDRIPLQATRGCPRDCVFCGSSRLLGDHRIKPIPAIRRELETILGLWDRPFIELADDNTFLAGGWSLEFAKLLGEFGVRWFSETDLSIADDGRLLDALAKSGCAQLLVGIERGGVVPVEPEHEAAVHGDSV